jgi:cytochrome d ubiquinol oxidase subunit I
MVGAGTLMILLGGYALFKIMADNYNFSPRMGKIMLGAIALPYIGNTFGWIMTEIGRTPWAVYGLLKLEDAISPNVGVGALWISLIGFVLIYGVLMAADIYLLTKFTKAGPAATDAPAAGDANLIPEPQSN